MSEAIPNPEDDRFDPTNPHSSFDSDSKSDGNGLSHSGYSGGSNGKGAAFPLQDLVNGPTGHVVPRGTGVFGMWLFLSSLGMLFAASMLGYVLIRFMQVERDAGAGWGTVHAPGLLWFSTLVILVSSMTIHLAVKAVERERQQQLRRYLALTFMLSLMFVAAQVPAMIDLLQAHGQVANDETNTFPTLDGSTPKSHYLFTLVFFLVMVHALHVLGGIIPLAVVTKKAFMHRYDHEHYQPVKLVAMYWHFLDVVWIVMFAILLLTA